MFELSLGEMALVAVVALVVIGPKDLPKVIRTVSSWWRSAQGVVGELRQSVDELKREAANEVRAIEEDAQYIIDDNGIRQRVYDISDMIPSKPANDSHADR